MTAIEEKAKSVTEELLNIMELPYNAIAVTKEENQIIRINIDTNEASMLIGWHGETINALQHIVKSLIWNKEEVHESYFLIVDTDDYKRRQEENVLELAEEKANSMNDKNTEILLPPMSSYFRRIIHLHFNENEHFSNIATESVGAGDHRQVKLLYKG